MNMLCRTLCGNGMYSQQMYSHVAKAMVKLASLMVFHGNLIFGIENLLGGIGNRFQKCV